MRKNNMKVIAVVLLFAVVALCDVPCHCEHPWIAGEWKLSIGAVEDAFSSLNCDSFPVAKTLNIGLTDPDVAIDLDTHEKGFWTMVYDQGFELVIHEQKFFAFFNWTTIGSNVTSNCNKTIPGNFHEVPKTGVPPSNWGCFQGAKVESTGNEIHSYIRRSERLVIRSDPELARAVNTMKTTWTARKESLLEGKELESMVLTHGRPEMGVKAAPITTEQLQQIQEYPDTFDWRSVDGVNYVIPIRDQLACGSCYAFGPTSMLGSRLRIRTSMQNQMLYSPQDIVSCSPYSQGCDGGMPYLSAKYGEDFGIVSDSCFPYQSGIEPVTCSQKCSDKSQIHFVTNYRYVGGYFGACNEALMMQEILNNGPLEVCFFVYPDFMQYHSGIYQHTGLKSKVNPFEPTNHSVFIVGWGVENGMKYWIVLNSWGRHFGEGGYFRIVRGSDECAIESMAMAADPVIF